MLNFNPSYPIAFNFFHKTFGYAMGSPVSAVIAELVMQEIESIAFETTSV